MNGTCEVSEYTKRCPVRVKNLVSVSSLTALDQPQQCRCVIDVETSRDGKNIRWVSFLCWMFVFVGCFVLRRIVLCHVVFNYIIL